MSPLLVTAHSPDAPHTIPPSDLQTADAHQQAGRYADAARIYHFLLQRDHRSRRALRVMHHKCGHVRARCDRPFGSYQPAPFSFPERD
jgi:hypothetical protein